MGKKVKIGKYEKHTARNYYLLTRRAIKSGALSKKDAPLLALMCIDAVKGHDPGTDEDDMFNKLLDCIQKEDEFTTELRKESMEAIKQNLCPKCKGVIVKSWITSMMAASYGKRCECKTKKI